MANNKNNWDIKTMSKAEIITIRGLLWVLGIVLLIFGLAYNIFLLFGVIPFYFAYLCKNSQTSLPLLFLLNNYSFPPLRTFFNLFCGKIII